MTFKVVLSLTMFIVGLTAIVAAAMVKDYGRMVLLVLLLVLYARVVEADHDPGGR